MNGPAKQFQCIFPPKKLRDLQAQSKRKTKVALKKTECFIHMINNSQHIQ